MVRRPTPQLPKQPAHLTRPQMTAGVDRLKKRLEEVQRFDPQSITDQHNTPELDALEASIDEALVRTFGANTLDYERYKYAKEFNRGPFNYAYPVQPHEFQASITQSKNTSIALLGQAIKSLGEQLEEHSSNPPVNQESPETTQLPSHKVFVVHGREEGPREAVARFLATIGLEPIILHEQANQGRTVVEKVEAHSDVGFAVVLLTPDDEGCLRGEALQPRARQNVLLELGFFIGKLTRGRVCTLKVGELEIPSDWRGVIDEPYDANAAWKQTLARELKAAGYQIDWNKVMQ